VAAILHSLGVPAATPVIEVWNKLDRVGGAARTALTAQAAATGGVCALSALTGEGVGDLLAAVAEALAEPLTAARLHLPFAEGRRRAWLHAAGVVAEEREAEDGWHLALRWTARQAAEYSAL
jgi:GTP-binding protein HflX